MGGRRFEQMASSYSFVIVVEKEPGSEDYAAYSPTFPGCFTRARSLEEVSARIRKTLEERLRQRLAQGDPVLQGGTLIHVEELTITLP